MDLNSNGRILQRQVGRLTRSSINYGIVRASLVLGKKQQSSPCRSCWSHCFHCCGDVSSICECSLFSVITNRHSGPSSDKLSIIACRQCSAILILLAAIFALTLGVVSFRVLLCECALLSKLSTAYGILV